MCANEILPRNFLSDNNRIGFFQRGVGISIEDGKAKDFNECWIADHTLHAKVFISVGNCDLSVPKTIIAFDQIRPLMRYFLKQWHRRKPSVALISAKKSTFKKIKPVN